MVLYETPDGLRIPKPDGVPVITRISVYAVVLSRDGRKILMLRSRRKPYLWKLPGGGIEQEERHAETIRRECREETGYDVRVIRIKGTNKLKYIGSGQGDYVSRTGEFVNATHQFIACRLERHRAHAEVAHRMAKGETNEVRWLPFRDLPDKDIHQSCKDQIELLKNKKRRRRKKKKRRG